MPISHPASRRPPSRSRVGDNGWLDGLQTVGPYPPLHVDMTADWVVIGGGFAGMAAARRLAETVPGERIVLLEALEIGDGPAGRSSGFMIDLPHKLDSKNYAGDLRADAEQTARNRLAIAFVKRVVEEDGLDPSIQLRNGKINVAASDHGEKLLEAYGRHLDALSESYQRLDGDDLHRLTGSRYYRCGLLTPKSALLHPAAFLRGVARALVLRGVAVHENSAVSAFEDGATKTVHTAGGRIRAPKVILAVNGAVSGFGHFRGRLMDVFTFASLTRVLSDEERDRLGGEPSWGLLPADPMGTTVRRLDGALHGGTRILTRNRFTFRTNGRAFEGARLEAIARQHRESFEGRYPALAHVPMSHVWGGRLCLSKNGMPAFGEVAPGVFSAACQNGLGSVNGTLNGLLAADLATGREGHGEMIAAMKAVEPPARVLPGALMRLVGNAVLARREARAGAEL